MELFVEEKNHIDIINRTQTWKLWCRLCANQQDSTSSIKVTFEENVELSSTQNAVNNKIIQKYFEINITEDDMYPKMICSVCYNFIQSIIDFSKRVTEVQEMYINLSSGLLNASDAKLNTKVVMKKAHDLETKPTISVNEKVLFNYENLEQPITPPAIVKGEPRECDESKKTTVESDVEPECIVETLYDTSNSNVQESDDEDPFSKIDNNDDDGDEDNDRLYRPSRSKSLKRLKRKCTKLRETKLKYKNQSKINIQEIKANVNCKICDKSFQLLHLYCKHMMSSHGLNDKSKNWVCPKCGKVVSSTFHLTQHFQSHAVPCPECDKTFSTNNQLEAHIKFHHQNEKAFVCEECGMCLRTSHNLKVHMETHTDIAPYECEVCKKKWKNPVALKRHMETHSSKTYICVECGLHLKSRTTLKRHQLVHSDEMQHKCDYCGRAFKRVKALKNHLLLHTGLKPYICDFCDRTFASGGNCRTHKKKMHPEELAALEADGNKRFTKNIPKLEVLKAIAKTSHNLTPVVTKQSGCFAFRPKIRTVQPVSLNKNELQLIEQATPINNDINNVASLHSLQSNTEAYPSKKDHLTS